MRQKIFYRKCWITSKSFDETLWVFFVGIGSSATSQITAENQGVSKKNSFEEKFFGARMCKFTRIQKAIITRVKRNKNHLPKSNRCRDTNVQSCKIFFSHLVFLGFFIFPRLQVVLHKTCHLPVTIGCVSPAFLYVLMQIPLLSLTCNFQFIMFVSGVWGQNKHILQFQDFLNSIPYYHPPRIFNYRRTGWQKSTKHVKQITYSVFLLKIAHICMFVQFPLLSLA